MQDLPQIGAFRIPDHVALTELMEMKVTLKMDCEGAMTTRRDRGEKRLSYTCDYVTAVSKGVVVLTRHLY